jgi:aconitate hydratase
LPWRSNIPEIAKWAFWQIDESYYERAIPHQQQGSFVVGGENYGQGSSREHAALAPKYLGLKAVLAKSFARIHWQTLINFAILPLTFVNPQDYDRIAQEDKLFLPDIRTAIARTGTIRAMNKTRDEEYELHHGLSERQVEVILEGSLINLLRKAPGHDVAPA